MARKIRQTWISTATTKRNSESGFSLVELLVVFGLMALITGVFVPSLTGAFRVKGESVARRLALDLGQARDRAMLADKLLRLKVDFDKQIISLDEAPSNFLVTKEPERPPSEREREEMEKKEAETFQPATGIMKEPLKLSGGLKIIQVNSPRYKKPVREGVAYVYFFNNGNTDGATLFFETDEKVHQAVLLHPITGQSRIEPLAPEEMK